MRNGILTSFGALLTSAGICFGQAPMPTVLPTTTPAAPTSSIPATRISSLPMSIGSKPACGTLGAPCNTPAPTCGATTAPCQSQAAAAPSLPLGEVDGPVGPRLYGSADYLMWWTRSSPLSVPLATQGNLPGIVPGGPAPAGTLVGPGGINTSVVLGGQPITTDMRHGGRYTVGGWLLDGMGAEVTYLFLAQAQVIDSVATSGAPGSPTLFVPFRDAVSNVVMTGPLLGAPVAGPGATLIYGEPASGRFTSRLTSYLDSWEFNGVLGCKDMGAGSYVQFLSGIRFLNLHENLTFTTQANTLGPVLPGGFLHTTDRFDGRNFFYGSQIGIRGGTTFGRVSINGTAKVALGWMYEDQSVNGQMVTNHAVPPGLGVGAAFPGGAFAQPTNSVTFSRTRFAAIPELDLNLGYRICDGVRIRVGYSWIYVSDAIRPGMAIDPVINPSRTAVAGNFGLAPVGPSRPAPIFRPTDFWAQGINFGLDFWF